MSTLLCNTTDFLNGLPIYENNVIGKIGIYNTREQYEEISYNDETGEEDHVIKSCFFDKVSENHLTIKGNDILCSNSSSTTLDTDVSKWQYISGSMKSRLAHDESYGEEHKIKTKAQSRYCMVYKKNTIDVPSAIIKETYMSDPDEPEVLKKKTTDITTIDGPEVHNSDHKEWTSYNGTESFVMDATNMIGDYLKAKVIYAYTTDGELVRLHMGLSNVSEDTLKYVIPKCKPADYDNKVVVKYIRKSEPNKVLQEEEFEIDNGRLMLSKVTTGDNVVEFSPPSRLHPTLYSYIAKVTSTKNFKNKSYAIQGFVDVPTSAEFFVVNLDKYGIPTMPTNPYFDATYITDPTGEYKRVHAMIHKFFRDNFEEYSYYYDEYGIINSQLFNRKDGQSTECCKYETKRIIDDEGNYKGTIIESFINSNPCALNTTKEYFYRAVLIQEGRIVKDYRALMVKDDD